MTIDPIYTFVVAAAVWLFGFTIGLELGERSEQKRQNKEPPNKDREECDSADWWKSDV